MFREQSWIFSGGNMFRERSCISVLGVYVFREQSCISVLGVYVIREQ